MTIPNSPFKNIETKKKRIFFLKLFIFLAFLFGGRFSPVVQEFLNEYPGMDSLHTAILFLLGGNIIISLARLITARIYLRKAKDEKVHGNFLLGISWISNILNSLVFLIAFMLAFDIQPLEFLTSLTIVAAAIAILSKDYVTNIINGLIMMFTDQFSLGDTIQIGKTQGVIEDITLLNVVLKKDDGYKTMVPNSLILNAQVTNFRNLEKKKIEFPIELPHGFKYDISTINSKLKETFANRVEEKSISNLNLTLQKIQKEFITLKVSFETPVEREAEVQAELHQFLLSLFNEN
ncbi:mechanosensitive ion channel family protein [Aquiflexum sp.]|uniref:mechanosensitive ion channel family protein n=1 Tax=Aquiflexum sp. TaxID=1872584 RepID=UPI0035943440